MSKENGKETPATGSAGVNMKSGTIVVVALLIIGVVYLRGRKDGSLTPAAPATETAVTPAPAAMVADTAAPTADTPAAAAARLADRSRAQGSGRRESAATPPPRPATSPAPQPPAVDTPVRRELPRLVDLGAHRCIPCKMMAPILDDLKANYSDRFKTTFIDVWQDQEAGNRYGIRVIPTQIFFDENGKELFRHEGFFSKEDILSTWRRLGYQV